LDLVGFRLPLSSAGMAGNISESDPLVAHSRLYFSSAQGGPLLQSRVFDFFLSIDKIRFHVTILFTIDFQFATINRIHFDRTSNTYKHDRFRQSIRPLISANMAASDDLEKLDKEITDVLDKETKESEKVRKCASICVLPLTDMLIGC
jgi:hypothetical protein